VEGGVEMKYMIIVIVLVLVLIGGGVFFSLRLFTLCCWQVIIYYNLLFI
jgi:hypothetical protein